MKNSGCRCEYTEERDDDIMRAYITEIGSSGIINLPNVFNRIVNMPSKRFWVSSERAAIVISSIMKGNTLAGMRKMKREMFYEIYRRVMELKQDNPGKSIYELVFQVVHEPAPKFYLTAGSAKVIIYRVKKQWHRKQQQRLRRLR